MNKKLAIGLVVLSLSLVAPLSAQDGASSYKSKCSACHGAAGEGKKGPALKGTSKSADDIVALLTKGDSGKKAPHTKPVSGMDDAKAKAIADYIKSL